jgi:CMP/dCMP kinase
MPHVPAMLCRALREGGTGNRTRHHEPYHSGGDPRVRVDVVIFAGSGMMGSVVVSQTPDRDGNVERCVVAVDGPAGSGKSTVSRRLAAVLDGAYLDTGAMYRAVTWAVLRAGVDLDDVDGIAKIAHEVVLESGTDPESPHIRVDGVAVDAPIRGPEVTQAVSAVAAVPQVRRALVAQQQKIIASHDRLVGEGRDIGAVVAPDADLKVYLTASAAERARRRSLENTTDQTATAEELARRDQLDSTRSADPLRLVDGAVELDTTGMDIDQVVGTLGELVARRTAG